MDYEIELLASVREQLRALPKDVRYAIGSRINRLQTDLTGDVKKLRASRISTGYAWVTIECCLSWKPGASWCMMSVIAKTFMSNTTLARPRTKRDWKHLNAQVAQAKTLLRKMRETIEDIEDARIIEQAKKANGNRARIPWSEVKKEFGFGS